MSSQDPDPISGPLNGKLSPLSILSPKNHPCAQSHFLPLPYSYLPIWGSPCRQALTPLQEVGHILVLGQVGGTQLLVDAQEKVEQGLQPQEAGVQHQLLEPPQPHLG